MRTFGLLGKNIDYSFSRKYFSDKFSRENIDAEYRNFDIESIEIFPEILNQNSISGLNVTIPYKESIIPFLDELDVHAKKIKAVNTIKFKPNGKLIGYNTDYYGFLKAIEPHLELPEPHALILGTGGASKAIAYALDLKGIPYKYVSRKPEKNDLAYTDLDRTVMDHHNIIINCTPLGTFPKTALFPSIPIEYVTQQHLLFDLIYNPAETKLMKLFSERGAKILNGLRMLEEQAEKAWEIWNS